MLPHQWLAGLNFRRDQTAPLLPIRRTLSSYSRLPDGAPAVGLMGDPNGRSFLGGFECPLTPRHRMNCYTAMIHFDDGPTICLKVAIAVRFFSPLLSSSLTLVPAAKRNLLS